MTWNVEHFIPHLFLGGVCYFCGKKMAGGSRGLAFGRVVLHARDANYTNIITTPQLLVA